MTECECGKVLSETGMTRCEVPNCMHDTSNFDMEVTKQRNAITLPILDLMSRNEMPACYAVSRATVVAVASLAMMALKQNEMLLANKKNG